MVISREPMGKSRDSQECMARNGGVGPSLPCLLLWHRPGARDFLSSGGPVLGVTLHEHKGAEAGRGTDCVPEPKVLGAKLIYFDHIEKV